MIGHIGKIGLWLFCMLLCSLVLSVRPAAAADRNNESIMLKGNLLVHSNAVDFSHGITEDTTVSSHNGSAGIELGLKGQGYFPYGLYTSPEIVTEPFTQVIASWNGSTPHGTYLTIEVQVRVGQVWSEWFSWGVWKSFGDSGSSVIKPQSVLADIDIDTLKLKTGKKATAFRYRLKLHTERQEVTPSIHLVAVTLRDETLLPTVTALDSKLDKLTKVLDVPLYSQQVRNPKIADKICSPTSLAMVMNYYGIQRLPEEAAWGAKDHVGNVFGNWSFNCAYAGSFGLTAYVAFQDSIEQLKQEVVKGHPVIVSVAYRNSKRVPKKFPILDNAPIPYTDGHLLVVRGFIYKDGKEYVAVNDPAAKDNDSVYREYLLSQFREAWLKVSYVISQENSVNIIPQRIPARLSKAGTAVKKEEKVFDTYVLKDGGATVDLSETNIRSIIVESNGKTTEFIAPDRNSLLFLARNHSPGLYKIVVIAKNGNVYQAELEIK